MLKLITITIPVDLRNKAAGWITDDQKNPWHAKLLKCSIMWATIFEQAVFMR